MKAVVVEIRKKDIACLTDDGSFIRLKNENQRLGQELETEDFTVLSDKENVISFSKKTKIIVASIAAALILSIGAFAGLYYTPYGTVTLAADSGIEYTINRFNYVIGVKASNEEDETILEEIDSSSLTNKSIEDALSETIEKLEENGHLSEDSSDISISTELNNSKKSRKLQEKLETQVESLTKPETNDQNNENVPANDNSPAENGEAPNGERPADAPNEGSKGEATDGAPNGAPNENGEANDGVAPEGMAPEGVTPEGMDSNGNGEAPNENNEGAFRQGPAPADASSN
ncbi:MAG: hypothetical protein K6F41_09335 [Lachnospira sp.]|nr:hypothetical protein [Lachnospira sp.]